MPFQQGDIVRVKVPGKFYGQEVKILQENRRSLKGHVAYLLDVKWDEMSRPSYFSEDEIELVEKGLEQ